MTHFYYGIAEKLPFKENSIDLITAFETVFFRKDPNVDREKKVPCMTRYTAEQISDMFKTIGFTDISINKKGNLFLVMGYKK